MWLVISQSLCTWHWFFGITVKYQTRWEGPSCVAAHVALSSLLPWTSSYVPCWSHFFIHFHTMPSRLIPFLCGQCWHLTPSVLHFLFFSMEMFHQDPTFGSHPCALCLAEPFILMSLCHWPQVSLKFLASICWQSLLTFIHGCHFRLIGPKLILCLLHHTAPVLLCLWTVVSPSCWHISINFDYSFFPASCHQSLAKLCQSCFCREAVNQNAEEWHSRTEVEALNV